jgi:hypothetical protein
MKRFLVVFSLIATAIFNTGCVTIPVAPYAVDEAVVKRLQAVPPASVKVGAFTDGPKLTDLYFRITKAQLPPPFHSFSGYIADALTKELKVAGKYADDARVEISGTLQRNMSNLEANGFDKGLIIIDCEIVVKRDSQVVYQSLIETRRTFVSAFEGSQAMPRAAYEHPFGVQEMLSTLYADPKFIAAVNGR